MKYRLDYKEEQEQELEVLKSIYPDELEGEGEFRITLIPEEQDSSTPLVLALRIKYTPTYPEEIPEISLEVLEGSLEENEHDKLYTDLTNMARDSIGIAMVFTLSSFLKDSLTTFVIERQEQRKKVEEDRIRKEIEEEQAKFQGTRVTIASFLEWRENFEREIAEREKTTKSLTLLRKEELRRNKLTGRQLFEQDEALARSDVTFMEEGDVTVDISLFEREFDMESEDDENSVLDLVRSSTD
ncbi:2915_t:CDS:2 [Scutellospora calospora]|uniref:2915_t:CDS:1 n=1 Tax=Scutellospora calospora TaxID=85575 RepID=A0ACA9KRR6_9GLOM|nr:2915_t:CDS:2 [Scutellospora calospora]